MKIAVFFENDHLRGFNDCNIDILIFKINDMQVVGIELFKPISDQSEYRMQILKSKEIQLVYLLEIEDEWKKNLQKNNINVKTGEISKEDKFINSLYFSNLKLIN